MSEELIQKIIGREVITPPFKVEAQHMIDYAESVGVSDTKYQEVAFPVFRMMVCGVNVNPLHDAYALHSGTASAYFTTSIVFLLTAVSGHYYRKPITTTSDGGRL